MLNLDCGILAHGFLRVHCDACGRDRMVAYSRKDRGVCSSCCGRRMADTAAHLVDRVLPGVPVRQWVLSFPMPLRYRLAYDQRLVRDVLHIFMRADQSSFAVHDAMRKGFTFVSVRRQNEYIEPVIDLIHEGRIKPDFMITHRFSLDRAAKAFELLAGYCDGIIKALVDVR